MSGHILPPAPDEEGQSAPAIGTRSQKRPATAESVRNNVDSLFYLGLTLLVVGVGLALATMPHTVAGFSDPMLGVDVPDDHTGNGVVSAIGWIIGGVGQVLFSVGLIAKGVRLGLESRRDLPQY